ncbi:DUF4238 domain-containing protein [Paraburkholderia sp. GAS348]|uniref:DUF4238 domain-containing protein n=1 Tax=Paraburkholderia sp. GAS348 TaxID=3035132 RepID=UPI003D1A8448
MPDNKKHHYVPKFYLRRFSDDENSINLYVLKTQKKIISANLANQCYRDYFYGRDPKFEKEIGGIEGRASEILKEISATDRLPSDGQARMDLLIFVLMQSARTAYAAAEMDEMAEKFIKHVFAGKAKAEGINLDNLRIGMKEPAVHALSMSMGLYPLLLDLSPRLILNCTAEGFIVSDNPVIMYNQFLNFRAYAANTGYGAKGLQIFLPIDDRRTLMLFDSSIYSAPGTNGATVNISNVRDVYALNVLQMCSATSTIYFKNANQNVAATYRAAKPFFRDGMTRLNAFPEENTPMRKTEIVMTSRVEMRTNFGLSFLKVRASAKDWLAKYRRMDLKPAAIIRDEQNYRDFKEFSKLVKEKKYEHMGYFEFLADKYRV